MGWLQGLELGVVLLLSQVLGSGICEEAVPCQPSIGSEVFVFPVYGRYLHSGKKLGKVRFDDCSGLQKVLFSAKNSSLKVDPDGTVVVKRPLVLHSGEQNFTVSILGSKSERKLTTITVRLVHLPKHGQHSHYHGTEHRLHHQQQHDVEFELSEDSITLPVLVFPPSTSGLKRRKRDWIIPPLDMTENQGGHFPKAVALVRSSWVLEEKMEYSITGPGATEDPVNLFTMDRETGRLFVTQPLNREEHAKYTLLAHAKAKGSSTDRAEDPMEIVINIIDQNDNKPIFTKDTYTGSVAESSPIGFQFMKVNATDEDEPGSLNSDVRYKILSQSPESPTAGMFLINPTTGGIQVKSHGLDRENFPKYTLIIQAADKKGEGLKNSCTAIITVTDSNDNAPEFKQNSDSKTLPVLVFPPSASGLKRRKRDWVIPPMNTPENQRGQFPKRVVQIRSNRDRELMIYFSITGPGVTEDPVGIFTIDMSSGWLDVLQPLDREKQAKYMLLAHAKAIGTSTGLAEDPMEIVINVIDQNDNKPIFTQDTYTGSVAESSPIGFEFMKVKATDEDEPGSLNAEVRYKILSQSPESPTAGMFFINPSTGGIQVKSPGLDRENFPKYTLIIQAADMEGEGLINSCTAIISVTDSNDNAPEFKPNSYTVSVPENEVGYTVVKMPVTDGNEPHTPAWEATFKIIEGDKDGLFNVSTGPSKQEGIITTVKGLDFEKNALYTLMVTVENVAPFATRLPTSTATVVVNVEDQNEAPIFNPVQKSVSEPEDLNVGADITLYTATDPDTAQKQKVWYKTGRDPAGWLNVDKDTGLIAVRSPMDRESVFMKDGKYEALILGIDDAEVPATGTGTLLIELQDVNDNGPTIEEKMITMCNRDPQPVTLSVSDKDGPDFGAPFDAQLLGSGKNNWTATMNGTQTGIVLGLKSYLEQNDYNVVLRVFDIQGMYQDSSVLAKNLKAADGDPTAPLYDSLLVFDYEGGGSEAGSLSSLNSSSSGDQDYACLADWGPRFRKTGGHVLQWGVL